MLKKGKILFGALALTLGWMALASCKHDNSSQKPVDPVVPPVKPTVEKLIAEINMGSDNGELSVLYQGQEINVKGNVVMQIVLNKGTDFENAKIDAKIGDTPIEFKGFQGGDWPSARCSAVPDITDQLKEVVIKVSVGNVFDEKRFKIKEFDETTLQEDLELKSFKIGTSEVKDKLKDQPIWRFNDATDPNNNRIKLTAEFNKDLKAAIMIVNEKETLLTLGDNKKEVSQEVEFEKNSIKRFSFIFQAEGSKDIKIKPFTLIYTNTVWPKVFVDVGGRPQEVNDIDLMSGRLEYGQCRTTTPKITLKTLKKDKRKITKVTVDGAEVNIETKEPGGNEEYVAEWTCNPPLEKAGESKTVRVCVEGGELDATGNVVQKEPWEFDVKFTLVQFIEASISLKEGSKDWVDLQGEKRIYDPAIKIKIASKDDVLKDVVFKDYKDADGNTPEFEVTGKEAIASLALEDTGMAFSELKIIAKAEGKTDTIFTVKLRYTQGDDPLSIFPPQFRQGDVEKNDDPLHKPFLMTKERARLFILAGRGTKKITSIKINNTEMLDKGSYTDPLQIIEKAIFTAEQGMGGLSVNAVIDIGKDNMELDKEYELSISLEGETEDGHKLTEAKLPTFKIKLPNHGDDNADWWSPFGNEMHLIYRDDITYHQDDKAKKWNNYYGVKSFRAAVFPKNPRATVKGFWYKLDGGNTEMIKIASDSNSETTYAKNWIKFEEKDTNYGKCKWCFDIDLDSDDMKGSGIGLFLYVVPVRGKKNWNYAGTDTVKEPYWNFFRKVNLTCSFDKLEDNIGWESGWKDKTQVIDELVIDDWNNVKDGKLYFRAVTFVWNSDMKYHLFRAKGAGDLPDKILEFKNLPGTSETPNFDNRFTVDVSSLTASGQEMVVDIPVYLEGKEQGTNNPFDAKVFTRTFTIKRK